MKILWLTEFYPKSSAAILGGVPARCFYVGKHLSKDHELKVIEGVPEKYAKASLTSFFARLIYLPKEIYQGLKSDFDIVEASNFVMYLPAWVIGKLKRKPIVFWYPDVFIGSWVKNVGLVGIIGEIMERIFLLSNPTMFIAISDTVRQKLIARGVPKEKISVIYCGVSPGEIKKVKSEAKKTDLISVSRLISYKRLDLLISAVGILKTSFPNLKLSLIGWGPEESNLKNQTEKIGLKDSVSFLGKIPSHEKVYNHIASSKLLCHPSTVEGFGISIIEALALGVPVVLPRTPIAEEVTKNGQGAEFFKSGDEADLARAIKLLLKNKNLYLKKRSQGLKLAQNYSWDTLADQTLSLYEKLIKN